MTSQPDNKKRKYAEPSPFSQQQWGTYLVTSNRPPLPPRPNPSPTAGDATGGVASSAITLGMAVGTAPSNSQKQRVNSLAEMKEENARLLRFHCDYCNCDISTTVHVRCAVCSDYDSCLDCFSIGAALKPHSADHAYRLIEFVPDPIYQMGWSVDEEEKLIEGIEIYGVGNWEQVANLIGTKNEYETKQHFTNVYLQSPIAPLPDPQRLLPVEEAPLVDAQKELDPEALHVMHMHRQDDAAGWMPKREEFTYEWDDDAEDIIGDMEIQKEDSEADRQLQLYVLIIYCHKLKEREKRKKFVLDRKLTDVKAIQAVKKKWSKQERDFRKKLNVFMCYTSSEDMEIFTKGMQDERALRNHITMLREGRRQGATTVKECERKHAKKLKKQMRSSTYRAANKSTKAKPSGPSGSDSSVLYGTSQRRARESNGDGSASKANMHGFPTTACATRAPSGSNSLKGNSSFDMDLTDDEVPTATHEIDEELMPGAELLSSTEISLCKSLKMTPHQYLIVKEVMVRESVRNGLRKEDAPSIINLDEMKVLKIYDYLKGCGWVQSEARG